MGQLLRSLGPVVALLGGASWSSAQSYVSNYQQVTAKDRIGWTVNSTVGLPSLTGGLVSAGFGTAVNQPREYGTHWEGFGKRYGMRLTGVATSNVMEASLGAVWGEDPRYPRAAGQPFGRRVAHVFKMTVLAPGREGRLQPAYARFAAIGGNNFLSNAWRPDSEATAGHATIRVGLGFLGRLSSNAFNEFWPDVKDRFFK